MPKFRIAPCSGRYRGALWRVVTHYCRLAAFQVGLVSVLIQSFKDVLLASVEERHKNERYRLLRMPVFFLLRVLLVFTPNAVDVNNLFGLLDGGKWESIVDSFIRIVSFSQQN